MSLLFQNSLVALGLLLEASLVFLIVRERAVRAYPVLFAYAVGQFVANIAETLVLYRLGRRSSAYSVVYWTDEMLLDTLLFLTVITLTYKALADKPNREATGRLLGIIVVVVLTLPFVLFYARGLFTNPWFTGAGQVLHFGAAIMNLALWTALIGMRPRDTRLLIVSAGVGLAATGAALFYGVFQYASGPLRQIVDLMLSSTQLLAILICCWAFWATTSRRVPTS